MRLFRRLQHDTRGATMIEYGLILALIFVTMAVGLQVLAGQVVGMWTNVGNKVTAVS